MELYYFLTGVKLSPDEVERFDLDSLILVDWHNDVSFLTYDRHIIILVEEQSTICNNMAIRCLVYYSNLILKMYHENIDSIKKNIYKETPVIIPRPEFYVLCIGNTTNMNSEELLSSHFYDKSSNNIEVRVRHLDINFDTFLHDISPTLDGHSFLTERFLFHKNNLSVANKKDLSTSQIKVKAMHLALEDCRTKRYLLDYLDREEFKSIAMNEFTLKEYTEILAEQAEEKGMKKGIEKGMKKGIEKGMEAVTDLYRDLMEAGKTEELYKAMNDTEYRKELLNKRQSQSVELRGMLL